MGCQADIEVLEAVPATGLVHAGGVLQDAAIVQQAPSLLRTVFAPKSSGWKNMQSGMVGLKSMHQIVLFSSIAAVTGPAGSAGYAAANGYLDYISSAVTSSGIECSSLQWGAWSEVGMVSSNAAVHRAMERSGIKLVTPQMGLDLLHALMSGAVVKATAVVAVPFMWFKFLKGSSRYVKLAYYAEFVEERVHDSEVAPVEHNQSRKKASNMVVVNEYNDVLRNVKKAIKAVHGDEILDDSPLVQAGIDSLGKLCLKLTLR